MKDIKYECYRRDRLNGIPAYVLAKRYINHETMEKRYQAETSKGE
jgi:hypothetical protein